MAISKGRSPDLVVPLVRVMPPLALLPPLDLVPPAAVVPPLQRRQVEACLASRDDRNAAVSRVRFHTMRLFGGVVVFFPNTIRTMCYELTSAGRGVWSFFHRFRCPH